MKAPYPGITKKEYEKLLKESRVVPTFVNDAYVKQSKSGDILSLYVFHNRFHSLQFSARCTFYDVFPLVSCDSGV